MKGGEAPRPVAGSRSRFVRFSERGAGASSGHSSMEGASDRTESGPLTGPWGKAVLAAGGVVYRRNPRKRFLESPGARRDRGRQRSTRTPRPRKTTPRNGGRPFEGSPISEPTRIQGCPRPPDGGTRERRIDRSADRIVKCEPARRVRRRKLRWKVSGPRKWTEHTGNRAIDSRCT